MKVEQITTKIERFENVGKLLITPHSTRLQVSTGQAIEFLPKTIDVELEDGSVVNLEYMIDSYKCSLDGGV